MCLPNENRTELLEFCYLFPQIPIEEGNKKIKKRKTDGNRNWLSKIYFLKYLNVLIPLSKI